MERIIKLHIQYVCPLGLWHSGPTEEASLEQRLPSFSPLSAIYGAGFVSVPVHPSYGCGLLSQTAWVQIKLCPLNSSEI